MGAHRDALAVAPLDFIGEDDEEHILGVHLALTGLTQPFGQNWQELAEAEPLEGGCEVAGQFTLKHRALLRGTWGA